MLQDSQLNNRSIRTFVRRSARMTSFQKTSYQNLYSIWCINYIDLCNNKDSYKTKSALQDTFSLSSIFGNDNPVICEVGFGSGDATYEIAKENSQNNYLCIEVFKAGIASLLGKIDEHNLNNIKIVEGDAVSILENIVPDSSISAFHFFFPDPWQKKKHNKRRFMRRPRTDLLQQKLKSGGYIYMVTDWESYAKDAFTELSATSKMKSSYKEFAPHQDWRPKTKFERKAEKEGRAIYEMIFEKV